MLFAPAVNDARGDSYVVLVRAAKLRVQVFSLYQTNCDMVGHLVVGAAAEGHREGTSRTGSKTGGAATDPFPSEQHLSKWGQPTTRAVRQFGTKQVVHEMGAGS